MPFLMTMYFENKLLRFDEGERRRIWREKRDFKLAKRFPFDGGYGFVRSHFHVSLYFIMRTKTSSNRI